MCVLVNFCIAISPREKVRGKKEGKTRKKKVRKEKHGRRKEKGEGRRMRTQTLRKNRERGEEGMTVKRYKVDNGVRTCHA